MLSSTEIRKLQDENKELKLRTYQVEQEKKKLLEEINNSNNNNNNNNSNDNEDENKNDTKNENDDECEEAGNLATFYEREAERKEIHKYILRAILSYTLLLLFTFSAFYIIYKLKTNGCSGDNVEPWYKENFHTLNATEISDWEGRVYSACNFYLERQFGRNSAIVTLHSLTFGLVSAVVVSQIGCHQQQQQSQQKNRSINKLTNQLLHATQSTPGSHIVSRFVYNFIMWTPRLYVVTWIVTGCACLLCGSMWGSEYSGPLYNSGQAWLGIAITTVYLSFGLQETAKENNDSKKVEDNVVNGHNNDNNDSGDDLIIENVSEENNAVTSSALLQTATSRSRFVEEKDGDDVEEGTLYSTGTKSNAYRNDDDDADDSDRSLFKSLSH